MIEKKDQLILDKCSKNNWHIHVIDHDSGYQGMVCPLALLIDSTHFIMKKNKIIYTGKLANIERYILNR